jgi:hypothetical protein
VRSRAARMGIAGLQDSKCRDERTVTKDKGWLMRRHFLRPGGSESPHEGARVLPTRDPPYRVATSQPASDSGLRGLRCPSKLFDLLCGRDVTLIRRGCDAIATKALALIHSGIGRPDQLFRQRTHVAPRTP